MVAASATIELAIPIHAGVTGLDSVLQGSALRTSLAALFTTNELWVTKFILRETTTMTKNSLQELYVDELKDLYSAEKQLTKALPKMAKAATSEELREGFEMHLEQTMGHVQRLEQIFDMLGAKGSGKKCLGMEGLIKEGSEVMNEDFEDSVMDAALIAAAQRVEHYEIAAYGTVCAFAKLLGETEHTSLLQQTLEEEKETDEKLTELSEEINSEAETAASGSTEAQKARPGRVARKPRRAA
jgi:ferritin-like metal-binding protein YciE